MKKILIAPLLLTFGLTACGPSKPEPYLVLKDTKTREEIATLAWPSWADADCSKHTRLVALTALSDHLGIEMKAIQHDFAYGKVIDKGARYLHYFVVTAPEAESILDIENSYMDALASGVDAEVAQKEKMTRLHALANTMQRLTVSCSDGESLTYGELNSLLKGEQ